MRITFSQKFKFFILLIIFLLPLIFPLAVDAFGPNPIYCFGREDCDRITCILTRVCADDQKGCNVSCINDGPVCPMQSACTIKQGIATDRCGYYPIQPSCTITANPSTGSPTTLTWSSDTQSCTGSWTGDPLPPSGSTVVYPSGSTTYTLTCANNCLDGSLSTTCSVVAGVRHENCCDNWGWNNVSRCGGCCGPAANCVGYDASAPYYWHNSNDLWQCSYSDSSNSIYHLTQVNGCLSGNNPPDMPTLVAPPHNTWINYNPTFQATVSDPDNNQVRAHFDITSFGTGISSYVNSGQTASWGPVAIADGDWWWRAKAQDTDGLFSASTAYWLLRKDTVKPVAIIDQENGESIDNLIWVNLTESDERSGIAEGDVDVRINGGAWTNTGLPNGGSTTDDFIYTAVSVPAQVAYTNSGAFTWAALTGVNTVTAEVWGGGGGGGSWPDPNAAGGGGGGAYSKKTNISVTPGNNYTVVVGAGGARGITGDPGNNDGSTGGDSSFVNTSTVLAKGGVGGKGGSPSSAGGAGGAATSGVGDTKYSGGTGGTGVLGAYPSDTGGGGGGSSAGTGVNGNNGANGSGSTGGAGGTAPTGGGAGGAGGNGNSNGTSAAAVGGGGGGAGGYVNSNHVGGNGYTGKAILTYSSSVVGSIYEFRYRVKDNAGSWSDWAYDGSVTIITNEPPTATNPNRAASNWCSVAPAYSFSWIYSDLDLNTESRFDLQVDNNSGFTSPEVNRTYSGLSNPSPSTNNQSVLVVSSPAPDYLVYNTTYYWRVKVYDVWGTDSGWVSGASFTTPAHQYPDPDFNLSPSQPSELELVQFTDNSTCYDDVITGSPCSSPDESFKWTISKTTQGDPLISFLENPLATFSQPGNWDVTLEVTDNLGTCSITEPIKVNYPLPQWKEVSPR